MSLWQMQSFIEEPTLQPLLDWMSVRDITLSVIVWGWWNHRGAVLDFMQFDVENKRLKLWLGRFTQLSGWITFLYAIPGHDSFAFFTHYRLPACRIHRFVGQLRPDRQRSSFVYLFVCLFL